jgi:hypothetical protein
MSGQQRLLNLHASDAVMRVFARQHRKIHEADEADARRSARL